MYIWGSLHLYALYMTQFNLMYLSWFTKTSSFVHGPCSWCSDLQADTRMEWNAIVIFEKGCAVGWIFLIYSCWDYHTNRHRFELTTCRIVPVCFLTTAEHLITLLRHDVWSHWYCMASDHIDATWNMITLMLHDIWSYCYCMTSDHIVVVRHVITLVLYDIWSHSCHMTSDHIHVTWIWSHYCCMTSDHILAGRCLHTLWPLGICRFGCYINKCNIKKLHFVLCRR